MDICRQKDHKPWSRPSFCGLSGYEPKIWHLGLLGRASCTIRAVPGSNLGHAKTKMLSFLLGLRGIWIYAAKRTTNHGKGPQTMVCGPFGGIYPYPSHTLAGE